MYTSIHTHVNSYTEYFISCLSATLHTFFAFPELYA